MTLGNTSKELARILPFLAGMTLQEQKMDTNIEQSPEPAATTPLPGEVDRRRFLKGTTLALPAVVTLHSGTALAATSLGCGGQGNLSQLNVPVVVTTQDAYMRESVILFPGFTITSSKIKSLATPTPFFFKGLDVWRYVSTGLPVTSNENTILNFLAPGTPPSTTPPTITSDTTIILGNQDYKFRGPTSNSSFTFTNQGTGFALVNLSNTGSVVSVGAPPVAGQTYITSLTMACFTSLMNRGQLA